MHALRRRRFIGLTLAGVAAGAGLLTAHQSSGYASPTDAATLGLLSGKEAAVFAAIAARFLHRPSAAELAEAARWLDGYLGRQPSWVQGDVRGLLHLVEHGALLWGAGGRFTRATPGAQDEVLRRLAGSRFGLLRQGYLALKGMSLMAGYRQASFLQRIGYDGPPHG